MKMRPALAFFPPAEITEAFEMLLEELPDEAMPVASYYENTYIGRRQRRGRREPTFPHALWSVFDRVDEELPRTNNAVEGWHRRFQTNVGVYHPNFWRFLDVLKREQALVDMTIAQITAGHPPPEPRRQYRDTNKRIAAILLLLGMVAAPWTTFEA